MTPLGKIKETARPIGLFQAIGRRFPISFRKSVRQQLMYAGQTLNVESWLGTAVTAGALFGIATVIAELDFLPYADLVLILAGFIAGAVLVWLAIYTHLTAQIEDRKNRIERILPDALHIIAANIKAGMTPLVAMRMAARPEFGPLEEEIKFATARALGTENLADIFRGMSDRMPSTIFQRSVTLLAASLKSGGKLVELLDRLAEDIRDLQELKSNLITNTSLYVIFIVFTVVVGTPLLLAVSFHFTNLVSELQRSSTTQQGSELSSAGLALVISSPLSQQFVFTASIVVVILTALLASALIGTIREGNELSGLKYSPFLIIISLLVFYFMRDFVLRFLRTTGP